MEHQHFIMLLFYVNFIQKYFTKNSFVILWKGQCCYPLVSMCANFFPKIFEPSPIIIGISTVTGSLAFAYIFLTGLFQILLKEK